MREKNYRTSLGGLLAAAAVASMFFGSVIPFATFTAPAIASLSVLFFTIEYGRRYSVIIYAAISILSALLAPDKEIALLFVCFFGYYPILKGIFESKLKKNICCVCKIAVFNAGILLVYLALSRLLILQSVREELAEYSTAMKAGILLLGNFTFIVFDIALTKLITEYLRRWRVKLISK